MSSDTGHRESSTKGSSSVRRLKRIPLFGRKHSPPHSTFAPSDILPQDGHQPHPNRPESDLAPSQQDDGELVFGPADGAQVSDARSISPASVFDGRHAPQERETPATTTQDSDEQEGYDLKPPPPSQSHDNIEALAGKFFSIEHLDFILRDPNAGPRFLQFLDQYKPQHTATLEHYLESKKAVTAIEYANAIADQMPASRGAPHSVAAHMDDAFEMKTRQTAEDLVEEALPSYLTHRLVNLVTDTLVKDITGNSMPVMKDLIPNLAEVYCITDPSLPDNPIVYASEEFYNTTQYGRDYVIGRNCRFLQGPKTSESTVGRMVEALTAGVELCETILNYRRDGSPFINLLMIAPLYDNKGGVRYFLGCQIDVSPLIEGGRGLDSFSRLLKHDRSESRYGGKRVRDPTTLLGELGVMLNDPEVDHVTYKLKGGAGSISGSNHGSGRSTPQKQQQKRPKNRRYISMDDGGDGRSKALWPDASLGRSGRLPGVYRNYLLVRPYPSLRITFTSPALRIPGLLQTKFMDRIGGSAHLKEQVLDAFENGSGVTAKVPWLSSPPGRSDSSRQYGESGDGKPRWIHCTPMLGSDEKVGVWMVVLVENEEVTGTLNRRGDTQRDDDRPSSAGRGTGSRQNAGNAMYADYLRQEGRDARPSTNGTSRTTESARERREVDDQFRDF
ncbi:hypothetical protein LTR37_014492 [Vermiconidia calcicola]|uniref:Uncharacterized protein n=1 Tax=Vermiconidia calcicola TaxID=1690605 RepID=A0ACC3MTF7_9PEZI|nr:hypothetical protein LTR37_014492 [Vermiconidia calcicola]